MTNKYEYEYEQDEPFGWYDGLGFSTNKNDFGKAISTAIPLYTHPAPSWQGLSDDEIVKVFDDIGVSTTNRKIYFAIEQALKEKNKC